MTNTQIIILIVGSSLILLIIGIAIFTKGKKETKSNADFQLDEKQLMLTQKTPASIEEGNTVTSGIVVHENEITLTDYDNKEFLLERYKRAAKVHKKVFKNIQNNIRFYFILQGIMLLIGLFTLKNGLGERGDGFGFLGLIIGLGVIIYFVSIAYYLINKNKSISDALSSSKYVLLRENQFPAIRECCHQLMEKMDLGGYTLFIYYVKTDAFEASVLADEQEINLLLSRSLITYYQSNPKDVESILGHEFGHVYQGDTKMLLVNRTSIQIPGIIGTISAAILALGIIISLIQGNGLPQVSGNILIVFYYWTLVGQRREAELLADLASLAFVENSTIEGLIDKYMPKYGTFNYPSNLQRLNFLKLVKKGAAKDQASKTIN